MPTEQTTARDNSKPKQPIENSGERHTDEQDLIMYNAEDRADHASGEPDEREDESDAPIDAANLGSTHIALVYRRGGAKAAVRRCLPRRDYPVVDEYEGETLAGNTSRTVLFLVWVPVRGWGLSSGAGTRKVGKRVGS